MTVSSVDTYGLPPSAVVWVRQPNSGWAPSILDHLIIHVSLRGTFTVSMVSQLPNLLLYSVSLNVVRS